MTITDKLTILAIILGPALAVGLTYWLQAQKQRKDMQLYVFSTLMSFRHDPTSLDRIKALNLIDAAFSGHNDVRKAWDSYLKALNDPSMFTEAGFPTLLQKDKTLLSRMGRVLGLKNMDEVDIERVYSPTGMAKARGNIEAITVEALRVLQQTDNLFLKPGIQPLPKDCAQSQEQTPSSNDQAPPTTGPSA